MAETELENKDLLRPWVSNEILSAQREHKPA